MPCTGGGPSRLWGHYEDQGTKAALCAILSALDAGAAREPVTSAECLLDGCDWEEAGIPKEWVMRWWRQHKKEDRARRARDQQERAAQERHAAVVRQARAKLTDEEFAAIYGAAGDDDL